jgi:hypothetical protein
MSLTAPYREGSLSRLGTTSARTGQPPQVALPNLMRDDLLIACPGWRPASTDIPLRTAGLLVLPVNREIGEGVSVLLLSPALDDLSLLALPDLFDIPSDWHQAMQQQRIRHLQCASEASSSCCGKAA